MQESQTSQRQIPRVFSGIQPTGDIHLGNYLGIFMRGLYELVLHNF